MEHWLNLIIQWIFQLFQPWSGKSIRSYPLQIRRYRTDEYSFCLSKTQDFTYCTELSLLYCHVVYCTVLYCRVFSYTFSNIPCDLGMSPNWGWRRGSRYLLIWLIENIVCWCMMYFWNYVHKMQRSCTKYDMSFRRVQD